MVTDQFNNPDIKVVAICGSLREVSYTRFALGYALEGAKELKASTKLIDIKDYNLVFCRPDQDESLYPDDVFKLRKEVQEANGIILGSPEYHGGYTGVLKNALDLMSFKEFQSKIVGLIGVAGGSMGAINTVNGLRIVCRNIRSWVLPLQVSIPNVRKFFDEEGKVLDSNLEDRIMEVGRQVAKFSFLHTSKQIKKFLEEWEQGPENPGGD
jgi:NAD(P)H-dependent FMN reductase